MEMLRSEILANLPKLTRVSIRDQSRKRKLKYWSRLINLSPLAHFDGWVWVRGGCENTLCFLYQKIFFNDCFKIAFRPVLAKVQFNLRYGVYF